MARAVKRKGVDPRLIQWLKSQAVLVWNNGVDGTVVARFCNLLIDVGHDLFKQKISRSSRAVERSSGGGAGRREHGAR